MPSQWQPLPCPLSSEKLLGCLGAAEREHTWRADAEKARRWAWAKAFLAANMMDVMGCERRWKGWTMQMVDGRLREKVR